jgi:DNA-binding beta-propeller fold protein YncE
MRRAALGLLAASLALAQAPEAQRPGPLAGGGYLLPNGWTVHPAGRQIPLETLPLAAALAPDGKHLAVVHAGYLPPSLLLFDTERFELRSRVELPGAWLGLTFSPDGRYLYAAGGADASVLELAVSAEGQLQPRRRFPAVPDKERTEQDFIGDVAFSPDGRLLYATSLFRNQVLVFNPQSGWVIERFPCARRPYRILFHPDGKSFFLTSWADGSLHHHDAAGGKEIFFLRLGPQPMDMAYAEHRPRLGEPPEENPFTGRLFVTLANTNRVAIIGIRRNKDFELIESINLALWPNQPLGMTPSAVAVDADGRRLFVACSNFNAVAVADISGATPRLEGFVPAGWYPTAVRPLGGGRLAILNGRGAASFANPDGPNPLKMPILFGRGIDAPGYIAARQTGSLSLIEPFDATELRQYTRAVFRNSPYSDQKLETQESERAEAGEEANPIRHVLYIIKGSLTFDALFGDFQGARGEPRLAVFGSAAAPNHHKLAREFVLFDNFYAAGDVEADGLNWSIAAIAPAYVERLWPSTYAGRRTTYDYDGGQTAAVPAAGYLWTNALAAGLTVRNYGLLVENHPLPATGNLHVRRLRDSSLAEHTNPRFRGPDADYPDTERARVFLADLNEMEKSGVMPRLMLMRLAGDHTSGTAPGKIAPRAAVADNDYALGLIVEACSKSRFWPQMAIFVVEASGHAGADHVDARRVPALVISPYSRLGRVDSTFYGTLSLLRTIELLLGLKPMTQFDAAADPMASAFQADADAAPYTAEKPRFTSAERNP